MKKCKYYQSEIDSKAKICPHCKKKQGDIGLRVRYCKNVLFDDKYTFQWTLNN